MQNEMNVWGKIISLPDSVRIGGFCDIGEPNIGHHCNIQCHVSIPPGWIIGNRVFIGPGVRFANDKHPKANNPDFKPEGGIVEDDVAIGMGALILPGIMIGQGATVGAGAVVTENVPPHSTVIGNPARIVKMKV